MRYLRDYAAAQQCSLYEALMLCVDDDLFKTTKARQFLDMVERFQGNHSTVPVSELLSHILDESGYERELRTEGASERLDNLAELKQSIYEYETTCGEESVLENYLSHIALFSNADTAEKKNAVKCMNVHEKMWPFPNDKEYEELIKSDVADIKNTGGREGGAITAGLFIKAFVKPHIPWIHLDIAGTAFCEKKTDTGFFGATGVGVKTILELLKGGQP